MGAGGRSTVTRVRRMSDGKQAMTLTGHCVIWLLHQNCLVESLTLLGLIWYCSCAYAKESRALEARVVAAKVFMVWMIWVAIKV
jgi:hypothetical protein